MEPLLDIQPSSEVKQLNVKQSTESNLPPEQDTRPRVVNRVESLDQDDLGEYKMYKAGLQEFAKLGGCPQPVIMFMNFKNEKNHRVIKKKPKKSNVSVGKIDKEKPIEKNKAFDIQEALENKSTAEELNIEGGGEFINVTE